MGQFVGRSIVTDGLVFQLDAANNLCGNVTDAKNIVNPTESGSFENGLTVVDNSYSFDGVNDYIDVGGSISNTFTTDVTFDVWINLNSGVTQYILHKRPLSGNPDINFPFINGSNDFVFLVTSGTTLRTTSPITNNTWYNVTITIQGTNHEMYLNGVSEDSTTTGGSFNPDVTKNLYIGRATPPDPFFSNSNISSVKIYNRALTQSEITQNYNTQKYRFI
jgi:hypothetical protein